ncbi:MAG: hypothetical protein ACFB15_13475 [Cyclobacteriaceae bacterium]
MACPIDLSAQWKAQVMGSLGYSIVDLEEWAGREPMDWNETLSGFNLRGSYAIYDNVEVGLEYGYNYLFWYQIRLPFGEQTITRIRDVDATYLMAVSRFGLSERFFVEAGLGSYFFAEFSSFAFMTAVGYTIDLGEKFSIPVMLRSDFTSDVTGLALNAGLRYNLDLQ